MRVYDGCVCVCLAVCVGDLISKVQVQNPVFDYVPPDLITLFISNMWVRNVCMCELVVTLFRQSVLVQRWREKELALDLSVWW